MLAKIFEITSKAQRQAFLLGDFNINLLNYNEHKSFNNVWGSLHSFCHISYSQLELLVIQKPEADLEL